MANRRKWLSSLNSIKNRLSLAFAFILLIPSLAIGWFSYTAAQSTVDTEMMQASAENVKVLNATITKFIQPQIEGMDYLAGRIRPAMLQGQDPVIRTDMMAPYMASHPEISNIDFGAPTGFYANAANKKMAADYDARQRPWYQDAMAAGGKVVVTASYVSKTTGDYVIGFAKVADNGVGVLHFEVKLNTIAEITKNIAIGKEGYVFILDRNQTFMVHPTAQIGSQAAGEHYDRMFKADSGAISYTLDGSGKKLSYVTNPLTGWKLTGSWNDSEATGKAAPIFNRMLLVLVAAVLVGAFIVIFIIRSITSPLKEVTLTTEKIADGDFTKEIAVRSHDELGQLSASVNDMVRKLRDLIGEVIHSSHNVAASSQQISATTEQIASGSSAQALAAEDMQDRFGRLSAAIASIAASADEAAQLAASTTSIAQDGGQIVHRSMRSMNDVNAQMSRLEEDSNQIGEIIGVIDDIAEQTNLLALNAAIEAARAGEQGRGFAVVADEVRKLAERSGEATKQISVIIKGMQENTRRSVLAVSGGVKETEETGQAFEQIIEMINRTERKVGEIAAAGEQQAAQSAGVTRSIENISSASQEAAAASQETAATTQTLARLAEHLTESVSAFKIK